MLCVFPVTLKVQRTYRPHKPYKLDPRPSCQKSSAPWHVSFTLGCHPSILASIFDIYDAFHHLLGLQSGYWTTPSLPLPYLLQEEFPWVKSWSYQGFFQPYKQGYKVKGGLSPLGPQPCDLAHLITTKPKLNNVYLRWRSMEISHSRWLRQIYMKPKLIHTHIVGISTLYRTMFWYQSKESNQSNF